MQPRDRFVSKREFRVIIILLSIMTVAEVVPLTLGVSGVISRRVGRYFSLLGFIPLLGAFAYVNLRLGHLITLRRIMIAAAILLPLAQLAQLSLTYLVPPPTESGALWPVFVFGGLELTMMISLALLFIVVFLSLLTADRAQGVLREQARELAASARQAQEANRAKSAFVARLSHELRTPFNGVLGLTDLALDLSSSERQREYLLGAKRSASSLLDLVDNLLDLSKLEAGKLVLDSKPFELEPVLAEVIATLTPAARTKGLQLERAGSCCPGWFLGDAQRLREVLLNLLCNAVRCTESGRVVLSMEPAGDGSARCCYFAVSDTGPGIPEADRARIFEPFAQGSSPKGGTGLGLSICRELVSLMGGTLTVESEVGRGSTFSFGLALPAASAPAPREPVPAAPCAQLHVLLAEDNVTNQFVVQTLLANAGHRVTLAQDGQEVLARLDGSVDVVLMDVRMPGMSGLDAARAIRRGQESTAGVPIVALSASAYPEDRDACIDAGMNDFLSKPIDRDALLTCVAEVARTDGRAASGAAGA